jgi:hypothetical protein
MHYIDVGVPKPRPWLPYQSAAHLFRSSRPAAGPGWTGSQTSSRVQIEEAGIGRQPQTRRCPRHNNPCLSTYCKYFGSSKTEFDTGLSVHALQWRNRIHLPGADERPVTHMQVYVPNGLAREADEVRKIGGDLGPVTWLCPPLDFPVFRILMPPSGCLPICTRQSLRGMLICCNFSTINLRSSK